ncbi:hypothetical protein PHJA_000713000 [Phtheirospermum japonicum]|uniref:Uncharacterized protein n=1 Tax=Phtheirospermum japonicum TaxID=374723 RepID=A0A830BN81_9LAMI|nr:hypothetical protein PHJA_000713000 [Phtheirospermum japonicum]
MEVVSENGFKTQIKPGQTRELGRDHSLNSSDRTISRRQVSFFIPRVAEKQETLIRFEVLGRNPIYVSKDNEVKIFRRFERGEMGDGDMFCVSAKNPVWHTLRKTEDDCTAGVRRNDSESELAASSEREFGFEGIEDLQHESVDNSDIDPVKEFGFVVIGHEFDSYPKNMIRDIKNWDWFIEEARKDTEDDDDDDEGKKRKRKKGPENDDDEWTGESEDDKVLIDKSRKAQRPKYTTRSKDHGESSKSSTRKSRELDEEEEEDDDEDEDDETLGGFIVDDEKLDEDEEIGDDDEEEEDEEYDEDD